MSGPQLLIALRRTAKLIRYIDADGSVLAELQPADALRIVASGPFAGSGTNRRVTAIYRSPLTQTPDADIGPWAKCIAGRAGGCGECVGCRRPALPVSMEWGKRMGYRELDVRDLAGQRAGHR